jgi:hypothetical protein
MQRHPIPNPRTCPHCGRSFRSPRRNLCCSRTCGAAYWQAQRKPSPDERFWSKVNRLGDCWLWTGSRDDKGYGHFQPRDGYPVMAQRFAYASTFGPIPEGNSVCHHCDNPPCVNPWHLFTGTASDNQQDSIRKGRKYCLPPRSAPGETNPSVKLRAEQVLNILRRAEEPLDVLAREFDVTKHAIWRIRHRKTWRHLRLS